MHQYIQHDWPPFLWAVLLLSLAALVVAGMGTFLLAANRAKRARNTAAHHDGSAGTARS